MNNDPFTRNYCLYNLNIHTKKDNKENFVNNSKNLVLLVDLAIYFMLAK